MATHDYLGLPLRELSCALPVTRGGKPVCWVSMVPGRGLAEVPERMRAWPVLEFLRRALS